MAATIGKVSAVFSASTSGLRSGVNDAIRSFKQMGGEANALGGLFHKLQQTAALGVGVGGPAVQRATVLLAAYQRGVSRAQKALADGKITAEQFAARLRTIGTAMEQVAGSTARGAAITAQFETEEEKASRAVAELSSLLRTGDITQETYARAMAEATGAAAREREEIEAGMRRMQAFAAVLEEGAAVTRSVETAEERHAAEVQRLNNLLTSGAISQETYNRAVGKADDELRDASAATKSLSTASNAAAGGVEKLAGKLNTLIAINAAQLFGQLASAVSNGVRSMVSMGAAQADVIGQQRDMAARLGFTYGELAGVGLAAAQVGVSMDTIANAATKADVAFVKAANGGAQAQAAFANIGLSVDELQGKTPAERFRMIADAIAKLPTAAERSRAAMALFGKAGAQLLPLFEQGAGSIEQATAEAERFGLALTNQQADAVDAMGDSFTKSYEAIKGVVGQVVAYLSPALQAVSDQFQSLIGGIGGANIGQFIGEGILAGAEFLATIGDAFIAGVGSAWEYVAGVADYWNGVLEFAGRIGNLFYGAFKLLEAVGNGVGFVITKATAEIAGLLGAAAEWIPGASQFAADMKALQSSSQGAANAYWEAGKQNLTAAGDAFGAVVASSASKAASTEKGPLAGMITDAAEKARQNMMAKSEAQKQTVGGKEAAEVVGPSTAALKATDSRSKEGVAEMFRLMRGDSGLSIAEQQLEEQRKTNELLSEADPEAIMQMVGG